MIKSKALDILNSFSESEMKRFGEYLECEFFNKNTRIVQLFNLIQEFHGNFDDPLLSKESLKKKLHGNEKSKDEYLRNLFSDLNRKAEDFLSYVNYRKDNSYHIHLIKELYERENTKTFKEKLRAFDVFIDKHKYKSPSYYHDKAFVGEMKANFVVNRRLVEKARKEDIENKYLFFLSSILESYCQTFIEQQRTNVDHDFSILNHTLEFLERDITKFRKAPLIQIYFYACKCFLEGYDENYFKLFKNIYDLNKKNLSRMDKRNISSLILSYYDVKSKTGIHNYYREALMIYMDMIKNNYLSFTESEYGNPIALRNIMILCMNVKDKEIFTAFMKSLNVIVAPDNRKEIKLYANSLFNIMIKDYKAALSFLVKINVNSFLETVNDNLYFKNDIKKYTIICFIELGYYENALVQIDSYKHYLNYSGIIPNNMKQRNHNFLNMIRELIFLKMKFDDYRLFKLEKKIIHSKDLSIYLKEWFLEKTEDMKLESK